MASATLTNPPHLVSRELAVLPPSDLGQLQATFAGAMPCPLRQNWRAQPDANFLPATVRTGWFEKELLIFAVLTDRDIFTNATGLNQKMWELGDTFEMFLRPVEQTSYSEFHVTPNNQRLQLRIPSEPALRAAQNSGVFTSFLVPGDVIRSAVWVEPGRWFVFARIPAAAVCEQPRSLAGHEWKFSFSRYDYTRVRKEPVCSSTSPHTMLDYHRQQEWGTLLFQTRI
jgi:hypothetical protein